MRALIVLVVALALAVAGSPSSAQEETTGKNSAQEGDVLTRYDDALTRQLAADYEALLEEEEAYLRENPTASFDTTEEANRLSDARLRSIENAPVPEGKRERAAELRRQAASLWALQSWAEQQDVNIDSSLYWGSGEELAADYEAEAALLEAEAAEEAAAREETDQAAEETTEATAGGAGSSGGSPAGEARGGAEAPSQKLGGSEADEPGGPVPAGGVNLLPVAILAGLALVGACLFAARRGGLDGLRESFSGLPKAPKPKSAPKAATKPRESAPGDAQGVTERPGKPRGAGHGPKPRESAAGHVTPAVTPAKLEDTDASSPEALSEWFSREAPGGEKQESRRGERRRRRREEAPGDEHAEHPGEAPAPGQDVNRMVAEEVARMRESGELGPYDEVAVVVENGKIVVRKKG